MEGRSFGGLALEVNGDGLLGDEVVAAEGVEADAAGEGAVAEGAEGVSGEGYLAADAGVVAEQEVGGFAQRGGEPLGVEIDGDLAEGCGAGEWRCLLRRGRCRRR